MAVLTSTGITFSDSTSLNSKYGIVPQNSVSIFFQASAPTGWTKSTTHNDKIFRVVSGVGGGSGGISEFSSVFPTSLTTISDSIALTGSTGNTTLTVGQLPSHTHDGGGTVELSPSPAGGDVGYGPGWTRNPLATTGSTGGGLGHNHPWSGTGSFSTNIDLRVQYIDVIICTFT